MSDVLHDDDSPLFCQVTGQYCTRAFCGDYGCANAADVPVDEYDVAAGTVDPDELIVPLPAPPQAGG